MGEAYTETIKIALHGDFATRKTWQIGTLIQAFGADKVAVVSAEHGLGTIRSLLTIPDMVYEVASFGDMRQAWAWAEKNHNTPDKWVCLDGMSRVMQWLSNGLFAGAEGAFDTVSRGEQLKPEQVQFARYITRDKAIDGMAIYGRVGRDSENLLNGWLRLNCNLLATYLSDMTGGDGRQKAPPYGPDVPGRVGLKSAMSSFDFVLASVLERDGSPSAVVRNNPLYLTRTREDRLAGIDIPDRIANFNLASLVRLITHKGESA